MPEKKVEWGELLQKQVITMFGEMADQEKFLGDLYIGQRKLAHCIEVAAVPDEIHAADERDVIYDKFYAVASVVRNQIDSTQKHLVQILIEVITDAVSGGWGKDVQVLFTYKDRILWKWRYTGINFCWAELEDMYEWLDEQLRRLNERFALCRRTASDDYHI